MCETTNLNVWVFLPTQKELEIKWKVPRNYRLACVGEVRFRIETDTPLDDVEIFQPGWKRLKDLEKLYEIE